MPREKKEEKDEELEDSKKSEEEDLEDEELEEDEENIDDGDSTEEVEAKQTPTLVNVAPAIEPPQVINGVVVPRTPVTGFAHAHHMTGYLGAHTSKMVTKATTHVRFSHPGLKAMVTREFPNTKLAIQFYRNPNNAHLHPVFVDPDSVHPEEMQEHVGKKRVDSVRIKRKIGLVDAPVGSESDLSTWGE